MSDNQVDVLVISPHPDDAEFGASGTVAKLVRQNKNVVYLVCTSGEKGTDNPHVKPEQLAKIREKEQMEAAAVLGVKNIFFLRYPDQELEETQEFRKDIVKYIRILRPELIITSDPYRRYVWHRDHRIVGRVVLDAIFPYSRDVWSYPDFIEAGIQPHKVKEIWLWAPEDQDVNFRVDITDTFDLKIKALHCHKSQIKEPFKSEMEKWLCTRAQNMAENESFKLGEGFHRVEIFF